MSSAGGRHGVTPGRPPSSTAALALGWRDGVLALGSHVCCYYATEQALREMIGFLRVGLDEDNVLCVIFADQSRFDTLSGWLQDGYAGDVRAAQAAGKLAFIGGRPDIDSLTTDIVACLDDAMLRGCTAIRFLGFIGWGQPGWPDDRALLEFESRVNEVVARYPAVVLCTYGVPALSGDRLIRGGLQTHPVTMIGDRVVQNNPFYVAPDAFIPSLDPDTGGPRADGVRPALRRPARSGEAAA